MRIAVALRPDENTTNKYCRPLAEGLRTAGYEVRNIGRGDYAGAYDLLIQTGFAASRALLTAIEKRRPYIIMEAPMWRPTELDTYSRASFGYNGLIGGAWTPEAPSEPRPGPIIRPMRPSNGATIIFGQKPTDHSLRGSDHVKWIRAQFVRYPDAELRHHPLMHRNPLEQEPLADALDRCGRAVTYSSTTGVEALAYGIETEAHSARSAAYAVSPYDREAWAHDIAWRNFDLKEYAGMKAVCHIMGGYDEARERAERGLIELPRPKTDGRVFTSIYHREFGNG